MSVSRRRIKAERKQRRDLAEQARLRARGRRPWRDYASLSAVWVVLVLVGLVGVFASDKGQSVPDGGGQGAEYPDQGNQHITSLTAPHPPYNSDPPTSGPHLGGKALTGWSQQSVPKELVLHNLEDGAVAVWYRPVLDRASKDRLRDLVGQLPEAVAAPYEGLDTDIALAAWTRLDTFNGVDERRIRAFVDAYGGTDHHRR